MDYTDKRRFAKRMIEQYGGPVTLVRTIPGQVDPVSDTTGQPSEEAFTVTGVVKPYTPLAGVGLGRSVAPAELVEKGGHSVLVAAMDLPEGVAPAPVGWHVDLNGKRHAVVNVSEVNPDGRSPITYTLAVIA